MTLKYFLRKKVLTFHLKDCRKQGLSFLHMPFRYDVHERQVGEIARQLGFTQVSLSSEVMPMVRIVPRGYTGNEGEWVQF